VRRVRRTNQRPPQKRVQQPLVGKQDGLAV
jgi:hypothetical protein